MTLAVLLIACVCGAGSLFAQVEPAPNGANFDQRFYAAPLAPVTPPPVNVFPASPLASPTPAGSTSTNQPLPQAAQRAVLLEQDANDPQGKHFDGYVTWNTETASPGPSLAPEVHADIEIPERHMSVTLWLRHNTDNALPASHTIQLMFNLPPDFPGGGIVSLPGIFAKNAENATGTPLAGISVKVTDNYFMLGLSSNPTLQQRNVQLLKDQKWFDIAIIYKNNVKAILAVEKGPPGTQAFANAFSAWDAALPPVVSEAPPPPPAAQSSASTTPQAAVPAAQDIVPPEIVQLENLQTEGGMKTVYVGNTNNHYVLHCGVKNVGCITPKEGKDYYLITRDTHWKMPGAKGFLSLSFLQDYIGKYDEGENVALLEKDPDPNDHVNHDGMFLIDRMGGGEGGQFGSGFGALKDLKPQGTNAAPLQQQAMCAAQAKKVVEEDNAKNPTAGWNDYQSHYNTKLNRCLIFTYRWTGKDTTMQLVDAFELHLFGSYYWHFQNGKKYWEVPPSTCEFETSYGQKEYCKSESEFRAIVAKYMGGE